jgi:hypothetical protein
MFIILEEGGFIVCDQDEAKSVCWPQELGTHLSVEVLSHYGFINEIVAHVSFNISQTLSYISPHSASCVH